jgi:hypothetical protein
MRTRMLIGSIGKWRRYSAANESISIAYTLFSDLSAASATHSSALRRACLYCLWSCAAGFAAKSTEAREQVCAPSFIVRQMR